MLLRVTALAAFLIACGPDASTPPTPAEHVCQLVQTCPQFTALKSYDQCLSELQTQLKTEAASCVSCVGSLTCAGLSDYQSGADRAAAICPTCTR